MGTFWRDFKFWKQSKTSKNAENPKSNESAAILVQLLAVSSISRCGFVFSKSREVAKSRHTVWPPRFNGRARWSQNGKIVVLHPARKATPGSDGNPQALSFVFCTHTLRAVTSQARNLAKIRSLRIESYTVKFTELAGFPDGRAMLKVP